MGVKEARDHLKKFGMEEAVITLPSSSASVELAAQALGIRAAEVAKSLTFEAEEGCILIVLAGDRKLHSGKFKRTFGIKAHMLAPELVKKYTKHAIGGVCPFGVNKETKVYLDESLKAFDFVYPACGESNNAMKIAPQTLAHICDSLGWVDVSKPMEKQIIGCSE